RRPGGVVPAPRHRRPGTGVGPARRAPDARPPHGRRARLEVLGPGLPPRRRDRPLRRPVLRARRRARRPPRTPPVGGHDPDPLPRRPAGPLLTHSGVHPPPYPGRRTPVGPLGRHLAFRRSISDISRQENAGWWRAP